jgi:hypothetical protein
LLREVWVLSRDIASEFGISVSQYSQYNTVQQLDFFLYLLPFPIIFFPLLFFLFLSLHLPSSIVVEPLILLFVIPLLDDSPDNEEQTQNIT